MHPLTHSNIIAFTSLIFASTASAHHGRDFLVVQDYTLPAPLTMNLLGNFSWEGEGSDEEFLFEPGAIVGLAPRLALEATAGFLDDEDGWEFASIDPTLHLQLTNPASSFPVRIGLSAGYQFGERATGADEPEHQHEHEHNHEDDHGDDHENLAAESEPDHLHRGIDRHGEDLFHARLILESDFTEKLKGVVNLIAVVPEEGSAAWGYSAGLRHAFNHQFALGGEVLGDFSRSGSHEVFAAGYVTPHHCLSFKLGAGLGLTDESPDFSLRTGVVWRF